jgi:hypothetical protein
MIKPGFSRQFYTFKKRDIGSKVEAGKYSLQNVPPLEVFLFNSGFSLHL